jgi:hypothetical protein
MKNNLKIFIKKILKEAFADDVLSQTSKSELSDEELYSAKSQIIRNYLGDKYDENRRSIHTNWYEYWLPIEAKEDLDYIGYPYYQIERVTNKEHSDHGKNMVVFSHGNP